MLAFGIYILAAYLLYTSNRQFTNGWIEEIIFPLTWPIAALCWLVSDIYDALTETKAGS